MWQDIEVISGIPFSLGSHGTGSSGISIQLDEDLEFKYTTRTHPCHGAGGDVVQLQQDLVVARNHAAAAEIETGSERERNKALEEENAMLREDLRDLNSDLQARILESDKKDIELDRISQVVESLQANLKEAEEKMQSLVSTLESEMFKHKAKEEQLRSEHCKAMQELVNLRLRNAVQEERLQHLQENLRDMAQASKQRETTATTIAHAEKKHSLQILEARLQYSNEQLSKSEERERQSSIRADEARQESLRMHEHMNHVVENVRKEMSAIKNADLEQVNVALESAKHQITILTERLQEQHIQSVSDTDRFTKSKEEVEKRVENAIVELEGQKALCKSLQTELDTVRNSVDTYL